MVLAAGERNALGWDETDFAGNLLTTPSISCNLPGRSEIYGTQIDFIEPVGA